MQINLFTIPFIIILGLLFTNSRSNRSRLSYIIICSIMLLLVASLRSPEWMTNVYGIDTLRYKDRFEAAADMSWTEFQQVFYYRYILKIDDYDVGLVALNIIISLFTRDFWVFSMIADLFFFIPFGIILYRYTTSVKQIMFSFVFYVALVQIFLLSGARQIFAIGFDMMALLATIDRKFIRAFLFFVIGITFHYSSFIILIPLLMISYGVKPKMLKVLHLICFIVFPIVLMFPNEIIRLMGDTVGSDRYSEYGRNAVQGGGITFVFLIELLSLFCLVALKKVQLQANKTLSVFYVMAPFLTLFSPLIISNGTMIRVSLNFHIYLALLVPYAIDCYLEKNDNTIAYFVAIAALFLLSLSGGGLQYRFFWQI